MEFNDKRPNDDLPNSTSFAGEIEKLYSLPGVKWEYRSVGVGGWL